ncbi:MAG: hypothetical protein GVY18_05645, partial [Bacteroidetes bacterium]|nr:hypothetical protein [Bacteroidota bacterium]
MSIHRWIIIVFMSGLGLGVPVGAVAQVTGGDDVEGYWLGAFVRDGSVQVLEAEFYPEDDTMRAAMTIPDWTYYRPYVRPVTRDEDGRFVVTTVYGEATMHLDTTFQEMIGVVDGHEPPLRIHLKRNLRPVTPPVRTEAVQFNHGDVTLSGTLVLPDAPGPHPAVVFVHGRGRSRGNWRLPRAKLLAERGIAALVYDKRGVG